MVHCIWAPYQWPRSTFQGWVSRFEIIHPLIVPALSSGWQVAMRCCLQVACLYLWSRREKWAAMRWLVSLSSEVVTAYCFSPASVMSFSSPCQCLVVQVAAAISLSLSLSLSLSVSLWKKHTSLKMNQMVRHDHETKERKRKGKKLFATSQAKSVVRRAASYTVSV